MIQNMYEKLFIVWPFVDSKQ